MEEPKSGQLEPLTEAEIDRIKKRDPQTEPLSPREWERFRQRKQRPEYSDM